MYIGEHIFNFSAFGPSSPWDEHNTIANAAVTRTMSSGRWAIDGIMGSGQSSFASQLHSFRTYQATATGCTPSSCLMGITLADGDNSVLSFVLPPVNSTGYLPLTITYMPVPVSASAPVPPLTNWTGADWMYFTVVSCPSGWITPYNSCAACPTGGYCPGGGRVWPLPGYWSFNEDSAPIACALPSACVGSLSSPQLNVDGSRDTQLCSEGYVS